MGRGRESGHFSIGEEVADIGMMLAVNPGIQADGFTALARVREGDASVHAHVLLALNGRGLCDEDGRRAATRDTWKATVDTGTSPLAVSRRV